MANTIFKDMGNVVGTKLTTLETNLTALINNETVARESALSALQTQVDGNTGVSYTKVESDAKYVNKTNGVSPDSNKLGGQLASYYAAAVHSHGDEYIKPTGGIVRTKGALYSYGSIKASWVNHCCV